MRKVTLMYFKEYGKYYSEGSYESEKEHDFEIYKEVVDLFKSGKRPGLVDSLYNEFDVLVFPENGVVHLLTKDKLEPDLSSYPNTMLKIEGKTFRCNCGANVFKRVGEKRYICNGCQEEYIGE